MSEHDFESLRTRVEATAERLAAAQSDRHRRNRSLLDTLARLEEKFAAQEQELAYYRQRVAPLEAATGQLAVLMARLLDMVNAGFERLDDPEDGVQQAIAVAAAMLEREAAGPHIAVDTDHDHDADDIDAGIDAAADAESAATVDVATGADDAEIELATAGYEDVAAEILAAEAAADQDMADMPETVHAACKAAIVDILDGEPAQPLPDAVFSADGDDGVMADEIGEQAAAARSVHPSADDIRALLARVEAAAAEVTGAGTPSSKSPRQTEPARPSRSPGVAA